MTELLTEEYIIEGKKVRLQANDQAVLDSWSQFIQVDPAQAWERLINASIDQMVTEYPGDDFGYMTALYNQGEGSVASLVGFVNNGPRINPNLKP